MEANWDKIAELVQETSGFNSNDILVHVAAAQVYPVPLQPVSIPLPEIRDLIRKSQVSIKESGVNSLCQALGLLEWKQGEQPRRTPLLLQPLRFKVDRVRNEVHFECDPDELLINPYLSQLLVREFGLEDAFPVSLSGLADVLETYGFTGIDRHFSVIGNFHHHRYEVLKELDELQAAPVRSHALERLLGGTPTAPVHALHLGPELLFPADADHRSCFALSEQNDLVVQGPPGTGKSQLLSNFIGKSLLSAVSVLAVSEKRSALEVIFQKLEAVGLEQLGFIATPDLSSRDFLHSLKDSWEYFERDDFTPPVQAPVRKQLEDNLQFVLDLLNQPALIGGLDYASFQELAAPYPYAEGHYLPTVPDLTLVVTHRAAIKDLFEQQLSQPAGSIRFVIYQSDSLQQLAEQLNDLKSQAVRMAAQGFHTWGQLDDLTRKSLLCSLFEHELVGRYSAILTPGSRQQKQFLRLADQYQSLTHSLETHQELSEWKRLPSSLELEHLQSILSSGGFLQRRRLRKHWSELNRLPLELAADSITKLKTHYSLRDDLQQCIAKLLQLGIREPEQDVPQIRSAIPLYTAEKWESYQELGPAERTELAALSGTLDRFRTSIRHFFVLDTDTALLPLLNGIQDRFSDLLLLAPFIKQTHATFTESIRSASDFDSWMTDLLHTHHTRFGNHYPQLAKFSGEQLLEKVNQLIRAQQDEQGTVAAQILARASQQFNAYQQLLVTPATKLTPDQKELKKELRRGKSILVKEFAKTRHFPSLRELMASEARLWIQLLKPVWLTNPVQLARAFPMEPGLFDLCIFDEASQVPLQHALGAIQRSKRVIIAGDDQQMGPTSYFKAGSDDHISLLQQANYYLHGSFLQHHYRSRHPELIAFANRHFYKNQLLVFPAYPSSDRALRYVYVAGGQFENRRNLAEARSVALLMKALLPAPATLGVVAFSQEQVDCIREQLTLPEQALLDERTDKGTAFLKPLEKVQGDECQELVISMGYAPDADGNFAMRFGPLNQQGGRNRLNVLLTRASERIHFFTSVTSDCFRTSDNESVNLLRDWLLFIERTHGQSTGPVFPYQLEPTIDGPVLHVPCIYRSIPSAIELSTVSSVLQNRGWELRFTH